MHKHYTSIAIYYISRHVSSSLICINYAIAPIVSPLHENTVTWSFCSHLVILPTNFLFVWAVNIQPGIIYIFNPLIFFLFVIFMQNVLYVDNARVCTHIYIRIYTFIAANADIVKPQTYKIDTCHDSQLCALD